MKQKLIATVATLALTVGLAGVASAQNEPNQEKRTPAQERVEKAPAERMEKGAGEAPRGAQLDQKRENEPRTGQAEQKRENEPRTGQAEQKRENEPRTGQAEPDKRMEQRNATQERRADENKAGQDQKGEKRADEQRNAEKRADEQRTGQGERTGSQSDARNTEQSQPRADQANNGEARRNQEPQGREHPRVMGRIKGSEEHAARVSQNLERVGRHETGSFDLQVGARLPDTLVVAPLPPDVIAIAPEYRGYDYVYVNDEIVFVEPGSHQVVGMIQLGDSVASSDEPQLSRARPCPVD